MTRRAVTVVFLGMALLGAPALASASPITFASDADYTNSNPNTGGLFRDLYDGATPNGSEINRGLDLGGTGFTALNFTGFDTNANPGTDQGAITLFDLDPTTAAPTLFSGDRTMSADILTAEFNNQRGAGLLVLFTEGAGQTGLALFLASAGNTDEYEIRLVTQTNVSREHVGLGTVALPVNAIAEDQWYRLTLSLDITGPNFTITGTVFSHSAGADPTSVLGVQVGSTLVYNGVLSALLTDPYEIGIVARGNLANRATSVTNFCVDSLEGCAGFLEANPNLNAVPEPGTLGLLGLGVLALAAKRKLRKS